MRLKTLVLIGMLAFFFPIFASAQNSSVSNEPSTIIVSKAKPGTYQFIISSNKNTQVFTDEILIEIEAKRDAVEVVYLDPAPGVRIMIPSRKTIEAPGFIPLAEVVYN